MVKYPGRTPRDALLLGQPPVPSGGYAGLGAEAVPGGLRDCAGGFPGPGEVRCSRGGKFKN